MTTERTFPTARGGGECTAWWDPDARTYRARVTEGKKVVLELGPPHTGAMDSPSDLCRALYWAGHGRLPGVPRCLLAVDYLGPGWPDAVRRMARGPLD